ncbi:inositol monophosphatase family protein [Tropicimonas isoalkanivorans]|uniref:Myo-inositol-1(Or 4)-monophosphatase n=1 Tax=Tropicimonas isoalkanivorans TaxID=441112 RepID=A0A1I1L5S0_9RHOB|nr:inositol monophosphatase [Tropicimonas isoalkanivorans]SFC64930.1 myo-inositol-1(or 4)-monophosphatase [Tropicimonas isoalkanivorans]
MPGSDLQLLIDAAVAAAEIACRHFRTEQAVWEKEAGQGPVTEADLAVDRMLRDRLTSARPDYGWMSEESEDDADSRLARPVTFVIDPIDGTRAFTEGHRTWAHSLAVAEQGRVIAAVVYLPMLQRLFTAERGQGAALNGRLLQASARQTLQGADILAAAPALKQEHWPGGLPDIKRHFRSSLAYRLSLVGQGRFDGMLTLRNSWEWDIAAGSLIAEEAGARVSDRAGLPIAFNSPLRHAAGVVCATPAVHTALVDLLNP